VLDALFDFPKTRLAAYGVTATDVRTALGNNNYLAALGTTKGQMVRTRVKEIRVVGRNTMGVKLMDLRNGEKLQAIAPVVSQAEEEAQIAETPIETA